MLGWFVGLAMPAQEIFVLHALAALIGRVQNILSSPYTIKIPLSLSTSKPGRPPCWVACLCVSGLKARYFQFRSPGLCLCSWFCISPYQNTVMRSDTSNSPHRHIRLLVRHCRIYLLYQNMMRKYHRFALSVVSCLYSSVLEHILRYALGRLHKLCSS